MDPITGAVVLESVKLGIDLWTSGLEAKAKFEADIAQSKVRQTQRRIAFNRDAEAFQTNIAIRNRQQTADLFNLQTAAAMAEDEAVMAGAGSGLTGSSISALNADISRSVAMDQIAIERAAKGDIDAARHELRQRNENRVIEASQEKMFDHSKDIQTTFLKGVGSGLRNIGSTLAMGGK